MGLDPMRLPAALEKLQKHDERRGAVLDLDLYPTLPDRRQLVQMVARRSTGKHPGTHSREFGAPSRTP
jgi:hypothetical protein